MWCVFHSCFWWDGEDENVLTDISEQHSKILQEEGPKDLTVFSTTADELEVFKDLENSMQMIENEINSTNDFDITINLLINSEY